MNNMDTRKTVLLTGCSPGGAGEAMAKIFQRNGLRVFATARNISKIESLTSSGIEVVQLDVTDTASLSKAVEHVSKLTNGKLDYLVSNAGGGNVILPYSG
jgi:1-acylglycerone phosphate reductase